MERDKFVFGSFIGVLGKTAMNVVEIPIWRLKIIKHPLAHYAASLMMDVGMIHHTLVGSLASIVADYTYGAFWGVVFVYLLYFTGRGHLIRKGWLFGVFLWFFSFGGLRSLPIVKLRELVSDQVFYYLFIHIVFGLALGFWVEKFGKDFETRRQK